MRRQLFRAAIAAVFVAGVIGCNGAPAGFGGNEPWEPPPLTKPGHVREFGEPAIDVVIWLGRNTKLINVGGRFEVACSGCVNDESPSLVIPCPEPCSKMKAEAIAYAEGKKVLDAMFDARQRGEQLEVVVPGKQ